MPVAHQTWTGCTTPRDNMLANSMASSGTISKGQVTLSVQLPWWFDLWTFHRPSLKNPLCRWEHCLKKKKRLTFEAMIHYNRTPYKWFGTLCVLYDTWIMWHSFAIINLLWEKRAAGKRSGFYYYHRRWLTLWGFKSAFLTGFYFYISEIWTRVPLLGHCQLPRQANHLW